jgi:2-polyprenyl-6-methoxyphenol hydroxylase-like FAD-dependent oxidoreductase
MSAALSMEGTRRRYDVVVVGARAAGAGTALLLARAGARVLVVDQAPPGADTLSTHALMRAGMMQLHAWGLGGALAACGAPPVRRTTFVYGEEEVAIEIRPQHGVEALMAPRRTVLDPMLAAAAAASGAEIRYRTGFEEVLRGAGGRVVGARLRSEAGTAEVGADLVIGADGRRSRVARAVGARTTVAGRHACATRYVYVSGLEDRGYRWHFGHRAAAGAIPTNDGLHAVFVGMPPARFRGDAGTPPAATIRAILAEVHRGLAEEVAAGTFETYPFAFAGETGYLRQPFGPGWALVGDAGYFKDPITAHGITDALRDAELLAGAVGAGTEAALAHYAAARDALSRPLLAATDALAALDWSLDEARALHEDLSRAMKAEQEWLAASRADGVRAA